MCALCECIDVYGAHFGGKIHQRKNIDTQTLYDTMEARKREKTSECTHSFNRLKISCITGFTIEHTMMQFQKDYFQF